MFTRPGLCLALGLAAMLLAMPTAALAYMEPNPIPGADPTDCVNCHPPGGTVKNPTHPDRHPAEGGDCASCHASGTSPDGYAFGEWSGPHSGYTDLTRKCEVCHSVHDATDGEALLPEPTVVGTCFACHDGTGGWGVYGTVKARTGSDPGGGHRYEATSVVPGGDAVTGGPASITFKGPSGQLICTDCHSPHDANVVAAFKGDRRRVRGSAPGPTTSRLLKQRPTGATTAVAEYGSDWCLVCHAGRASGGVVHNHPIDGLSVTAAPFTYSNLAVLASDDATGNTIFGPLGGVAYQPSVPNEFCDDCHVTYPQHWNYGTSWSGNRGYLMPYPRTAQQAGHSPICQQCHEDSRNVGSLSPTGDVADAATASIAMADASAWDSLGSTWTATTADNPLFQNFPHETQNADLLVETADDLCMNCHPPGQLP